MNQVSSNIICSTMSYTQSSEAQLTIIFHQVDMVLLFLQRTGPFHSVSGARYFQLVPTKECIIIAQNLFFNPQIKI